MQQINRAMLHGLLHIGRELRAFFCDRKAAVSIVAALSLPALIAFSSLVAEYGHGLVIKTENQRVADMAAYAGALAYNANATTASVTSAADAVASLNGVPTGNVSASLVSSPTGDGNSAVLVSVSSTLPIYLASVVGGATSLPVSSSAYAELNVQTSGCIIALSSAGSGVTLSGGTAVTATGCSVASNNSEAVPCGTTITAKSVSYNGAAPTVGCSGITAPGGGAATLSKKLSTDPLAGTSAVTAATGRVATVTAETGPAAPTVTTGTDVSFAYSQTATQNALIADGCSGTYASNTWTVTCTGATSNTYTFGNITTGGGVTVNFNTGGASSTTYNFSGSINNTGTAMTFGPGTYNVAGGLFTGGGTTTTFGSGTYDIGKASTKCTDGVYYSICNTGTNLTFGANSGFVLQSGVYNNGGSKLVMGSSGTGNSFNIGPASSGNAMWLGGGSYTQMGDATNTGSLFQMVGNFWVPSGGGSCTYMSAAAEHDIQGSFYTAGGTTLGSGVYTITGYVDLGGSGGGDVTCNGSSVGMTGTGVTLVIGGSTTPSSGTCSGEAFCLAAGYAHVNLTAPTGTATTAGLVVVGPAANTGGATFAEGSSATSLSGAFYFPQGPISLSGGASVGGGTGQCLEMIGTQVTLSGGTAAASNCVSGGGGTTKIALVQ